jgi:sialate O-acetylesterase
MSTQTLSPLAVVSPHTRPARHGIRALAGVLGLAAAASVAKAQVTVPPVALRLPQLFGDGMVLQRGTPVPVWGWAAPGTRVAVTLQGRTARAAADSGGVWSVMLPAMSAGGPYALAVEGGGVRIDVRDVLVGDVWVASGQSNMEWPVAAAISGAQEVAGAHDPRIRQFAVPHSFSDAPEADVSGGSWAPADSQHVGPFSAVGYFFARELRRAVDVPIGLIHTSWGGSNIETWMSRRALGISDSSWDGMQRQRGAEDEARRAALRVRIGDLPVVDSGLVGGRAVWADPALDDSGWARLAVPGVWERAGYDAMDGIAWYRTTFTLTEDEVRQGSRLCLGTIDDNDVTWVNGTEVGRTDGYATPRRYLAPPAALRAGGNVIAVRVEDTGGDGGFYGDPASVYLEVGGVRRALAGTWRFKVGAVSFQADGQRINKIPTGLYNRMLHPLLPFPIKGVIWYQGESNANSVDQAIAYRPLFQDLIRSWRREWRGVRGPIPFLWVQLPNFGTVDTVPPDRSAWAALRESQTAALALPRTGQAVIIDLGEAGNIHPRNKQEVGRRLALVAERVAYGHSPVSSGPTYQRHEVRGGRVVIAFNHRGGGLVSHAPDGRVTGFAVAGGDRRFVWAEARIEGDRIVAWSDRVPHPVAVRYAWSNSPAGLTLFNREGLPAAPFRTDRW